MTAHLEITKRYRFEAHHRLPWHHGKCARDHGHSYELHVTVRGPVKPGQGETDSGMVMDFGDVSKVVKPIIERYLDHYSLNTLMENPTAENLVLYYLVPAIQHQLPNLHRIRLYETEDSWVEWCSETPVPA